jgi:uncharacterized protein YciI
MKKCFFIQFALVFLASFTLSAQSITFDSVMQKVSKGKPFVLTLLVAGKALPRDQALVSKLQADHLVHLFQLEKDGKISIFGPVTDPDAQLRGIIIFNFTDLEKVKAELETDPYIKEGYLKYELYNWFTIPGQSIPLK